MGRRKKNKLVDNRHYAPWRRKKAKKTPAPLMLRNQSKTRGVFSAHLEEEWMSWPCCIVVRDHKVTVGSLFGMLQEYAMKEEAEGSRSLTLFTFLSARAC